MRSRYLPAAARTGVLMKPLFLANHPAIDFLNTNLAPDGRSIELLGTGTEYVEWLVAANLLDKKRGLDLARRTSGKALDSAAEEARRVREWMRAWLTRWRSNPEGDYRKEIAALNALLSRSTYSRAVVRDESGLSVVDRPQVQEADGLLGLVASQLAALITHEQPELIKDCANPACTLWFLDQTKSHRRMFCSASACGNRVRVAAFRQRKR